MSDERATYHENGSMDTYDGRTVYHNTADNTLWITVSNGPVHTHNADYSRDIQNSVERVLPLEPGHVQATNQYAHIIPLETYHADNPPPQDAPQPDMDTYYQMNWGNYDSHTPDWVLRWGTH